MRWIEKCTKVSQSLWAARELQIHVRASACVHGLILLRVYIGLNDDSHVPAMTVEFDEDQKRRKITKARAIAKCTKVFHPLLEVHVA